MDSELHVHITQLGVADVVLHPPLLLALLDDGLSLGAQVLPALGSEEGDGEVLLAHVDGASKVVLPSDLDLADLVLVPRSHAHAGHSRAELLEGLLEDLLPDDVHLAFLRGRSLDAGEVPIEDILHQGSSDAGSLLSPEDHHDVEDPVTVANHGVAVLIPQDGNVVATVPGIVLFHAVVGVRGLDLPVSVHGSVLEGSSALAVLLQGVELAQGFRHAIGIQVVLEPGSILFTEHGADVLVLGAEELDDLFLEILVLDRNHVQESLGTLLLQGVVDPHTGIEGVEDVLPPHAPEVGKGVDGSRGGTEHLDQGVLLVVLALHPGKESGLQGQSLVRAVGEHLGLLDGVVDEGDVDVERDGH